jgi:hypothetical protein
MSLACREEVEVKGSADWVLYSRIRPISDRRSGLKVRGLSLMFQLMFLLLMVWQSRGDAVDIHF